MSLKRIIIREYKDTDYNACRSLWVDLIRYHQDIYQFTLPDNDDLGRGFDEYLHNPSRKGTWVAELKGKVVGFAGLLIYSEIFSEVEPIIVVKEYRNKGIGSALMKRVVDEATKTGVKTLSIKPGARNKESLAKFVRMGFKNVWTIELIREINSGRGIKWLPGLKIYDNELEY